MTSPLLTLEAVAARLAVSPATVRRLVAAGQLAYIRVGRQMRFRSVDVDAYEADARIPSEPERRRATIRALPDRPAPRRALPAGYWER